MNPVHHFEITYKDKQRAINFYKTLFNWNISDLEEFNYTIAQTTEVGEDNKPLEKGAINGAFVEATPEVSKPLIAITVDDIQKTVAQAVAEGGEVVASPIAVGELGHYARIKDCEDNIIGLWQEK